VRKKGGAFGKAQVFKMEPHFDFTGVTDFTGLAADADHEYEIGFVARDGDWDVPDAELNWAKASKGSFRTGADPSAACSFVFGSCRYLLRLLGGSLFDGRGDKTFRSILEQLEGIDEDGAAVPQRKTDFFLLVGDQIYADDLRFVSPDKTADDYFKRYRDVFGQSHVRRLMSLLPTYMILDDHEIQDNWSMDRLPERGDLFAAAMQAYQSYQMVHGPAFDPALGTPTKLWYSFRHGCADVFVMDTRTERFSTLTPPQIIGSAQMRELKAWLVANPASVKFVVTSVLMMPDNKVRNEDAWGGFVEQRREILDFIRDNGIQRVVFLSGDVHCSLALQLTCSTHPKFRVTNIVSSSLYWPYPQGVGDMFKLSGTLTESGASVYNVEAATPVISDDNFTRVSADQNQVVVEFFARKGDLLGRHNFSF
jgi:alkaline phosphatase D